jgi:two-component system, OmpR family, manganese sensing sensor histidine kinase
MFQATRKRLALWYTAVTAVLLLIFATGVYNYVRTTLIERVDDTLNHVVEVVERSLVIERSPQGKFSINVEASFRNNAQDVEDDHIDLEWFSANGELLWSTLIEPLNIPLSGPNHTGETVILTPEHLLRQVTERVQIGREVLGYLRVSHPWFEVAKPTRLLIVDLILGILLMLISVAASGWLLSGIAIEPIKESYQRLKQFTSDASHELRNPIAMIQTNVQVALSEPDLDLEQRQLLVIIERLSQRLGKLVNELLFLARQDSGIIQQKFEQIYLDEILMQIIEEQKNIAKEKKIKLDLFIQVENSEEDNFMIEGDSDQIARLFTNLIANAVQYTSKQGKIKVELQKIKKSNNYHLQIKIIDTGIGIPETALLNIFDRFYRVDPARSYQVGIKTTGSGLGLAIAQAIVNNHHGTIAVESIVNQGTTFTVTLPVSIHHIK